VREGGDLRGPGRAGVGLAVDLGEDRVEDKVVKLFLVADVAVQRAGDHAEASGDGAHAERLGAVGADDREGLGDDAFAGEQPAAAFPVLRGIEPQRARGRVCRLLACHACLLAGQGQL
jgi:hypothetical protein